MSGGGLPGAAARAGGGPLSACLVIPVYNHARELEVLLEALRPHGLPCILVDDGSEDPGALERLALRESAWVRLVRHSGNQGKGAAVMTGARTALSLGYTHALQIDADGQHAPEDVPRFLAAAAARPDAVVCGVPVFDESAPGVRRRGRWVSNFWTRVNSLSLEIQDGMCGFRLYPLAPLVALAGEARLGSRMDFDPEVLVRLKWRGLAVSGVPTRVRYPAGGLSNFKLWRDNWLISRKHAILFFGMLARLPLLLARNCSAPPPLCSTPPPARGRGRAPAAPGPPGTYSP